MLESFLLKLQELKFAKFLRTPSLRFPACNFINKETLAEMLFCKFCEILQTIFSFNRTPRDDCFLCLSVNFENISFMNTSAKLLISRTSCRISTAYFTYKLQNFNQQIQQKSYFTGNFQEQEVAIFYYSVSNTYFQQ